jgi:hypothetical protein
MNPAELGAARFRPLRQAFERLERARRAYGEAGARVEQLRRELRLAEAADRRARGDALVDGRREPASKAGRIRAELEKAEQEQADLNDAATRAADAVPHLIRENESRWHQDGLGKLGKAAARYRSAIAELSAARAALSDEATLLAWLATAGRRHDEAATDALGGRLGAEPGGRPPVGFSIVLEELAADCENLIAHPSAYDASPAPPANLELLVRRAAS